VRRKRYKREYYADANPLFVVDLQLSTLQPALKGLLQASIAGPPPPPPHCRRTAAPHSPRLSARVHGMRQRDTAYQVMMIPAAA
jgi:hypothetical protein